LLYDNLTSLPAQRLPTFMTPRH